MPLLFSHPTYAHMLLLPTRWFRMVARRPFGLLPIAPMPEAMRLFVPAYSATRMIGAQTHRPNTGLIRSIHKLLWPRGGLGSISRCAAEVLVEALPQWIMQAAVMVIVSLHVRNGTASDVDVRHYSSILRPLRSLLCHCPLPVPLSHRSHDRAVSLRR